MLMPERETFRKIRLTVQFSKRYALLCFIVNLFCLLLLFNQGPATIGGIIILKLVIYGLICLYYRTYQRNRFYYYRNLGLDALQLFGYSLGFDAMLFLLPAIIFICIS